MWKVESSDLRVIVSAPTRGWIAVGFNPTFAMNSANIIIGYVTDAGDITIEDHYGTGNFTHEKDTDISGERNIIVTGGSQSENNTEIRFLMPLDSGDSRDTVLSEGTQCRIILSYGQTDNIANKHAVTTSLQITL